MNNNDKYSPLKAALVGGGLNSAVGRVHDIASRMDHLFELVCGCFSRNSDLNIASGREYRIADDRIYADINQLLDAESEHIDVVIVALPTDQHAIAIHAALDRGLTVITDKPTVNSVDAALQLQAKVAASGGHVYTLFNYTGYPMVRELRRMLTEGELGKIERLMIEMPQDSFLRMKNQSCGDKVQKWRLSDGDICGVSLDLFTHVHSLAKYLNSAAPTSAYARMRSVSQLSEGLIDDVDALIDFDDGSMLTTWYGKSALGYRNGLRIRVFGSNGSAEWLQMDPEHLRHTNNLGNTQILDRLSTSTSTAQEPYLNRFKAGHPAGFIEAFANCYYDIAQAIRTNHLHTEATTSLENAIEGLRLAEALQASHATGTRYEFK